jgi:hypothetical protein
MGSAEIPTASEIVKLFIEKTEEWFSYFPEDENITLPCNIIGKLIRLHYRNFYQWIKEEKSHSGICTDKEMAELKREIDASNLKRSRIIEEIDEYFIKKLKIKEQNNWTGLYINSQSLGEICDKLSVLCLKYCFIKLALKQSSISSQEYSILLKRVENLIKYVSECYDRFVEHLKEGKGCMISGQIKIYGLLKSKGGET